MMWRYHIYGGDREVIKVSEYVYDTEQAALDAAAEYIKRIGAGS